MLKRMIDTSVSFVLLLLLSPVFLFTYIKLKTSIGSPVIFKQVRPGKNEVLFTLYKFRTMNNKKDGNGNLLPDHERLTDTGKWIRKRSLDELPQLWNVLKGDISLVGPRPLLVQYLDLYSADQKKRHFLKPGITGWAQVNGRNEISWKEKFEYDLYYVENQTLLFDMQILWLTVWKVLKKEGIEQEGGVTPFEGNKIQ
ncbi:sugar transferase [Alkalicoccus daliensis]|uniref:Sugar transferase involved in LPS biosynthesis (Colanic, teichoic acid) n=1 Tax=Alkalicoccus daliensis TaxID=745820 RepID=A0A1G9ZMM8_9BACI|nr:sugar transferase [Alkalicoccus daliensis]SDN22450.1 Sugar transferase involved in LPS biosynthesis (colanic, teichoic acid) [Alkalicoccus daliensis]